MPVIETGGNEEQMKEVKARSLSLGVSLTYVAGIEPFRGVQSLGRLCLHSHTSLRLRTTKLARSPTL